MICTPCKQDRHFDCPETHRQSKIRNAPGRSPLEDQLRVLHVTTGQVCDCKHKPRRADGAAAAAAAAAA